MTVYERAAQVWSVLAFAAHNRQTLSYKMISRLTGIHPAGLGKCLYPIQWYCIAMELSPLTSLVVTEKAGVPGSGFFATEDLARGQQEVFATDWMAHGAPSPETLEREAKNYQANHPTPEDLDS